MITWKNLSMDATRSCRQHNSVYAKLPDPSRSRLARIGYMVINNTAEKGLVSHVSRPLRIFQRCTLKNREGLVDFHDVMDVV